MSFYNEIKKYNWDEIGHQIDSKTKIDVENALQKTTLHLDDFQALISPAAESYLEEMAQKSKSISQQDVHSPLPVQFMYQPLCLLWI